MERGRMTRAISITSSRETLPWCLMFLVFFLSRSGSLRALMTRAAALGTTATLAWRFCTVSFTVTRRPFQSLAVSLAMSSPTFLGDNPNGPILGANDEAAPTSPPVTRTNTSTTCDGSNLGGISASASPSPPPPSSAPAPALLWTSPLLLLAAQTPSCSYLDRGHGKGLYCKTLKHY
eukprot:c17999_g1_i1 orf=3-530(-)